MRIVFIIDQVYRHGGIERVLSIKANYLATQNNNTIHIITTEQQNKKACYEFHPSIIFEDLNINYHRDTSYFYPKNLLKIPNHILKVKAALKKIHPDVVVVCSHSTDTYFMPFVLKKIPKVKEFHYSKFIEVEKRQNPSSVFKTLFFKFADYVETKYDKLVVLNPDEAAYYKSNNTVTIPNPLTFYPETMASLAEPTVIAAGRIAPVKRYDILIDIWKQVHKKNNTLKLHIYGEGEPNYVAGLQKQIERKNLSESVFLKGATSHIQNKMLSSSLFVMTSDNECFPLVLLEAQACGLPIVSRDSPYGPRNIINTQTGVLIKMNDSEGFAQAILELMSNVEKRKEFGRNARLHAVNYSIGKVMDQWNNLFNELNHVK
ncbi:MAG: hypothetical protein B7Z06_04045 [Flavobacteriales bacterium 32-35-8]|nr:MAG: hypothetical protein B7Z06_04045 [Flavobacteriales bacterium 32-35-8]